VSYVTADAGRKLLQFRDPEVAEQKAQQIARDLAAGDLQALKMTGADRAALTAAEAILAPTKASIVNAAHAYAAAFKVLGEDRLVEAARFYKEKARTELPLIRVDDAVDKYKIKAEAAGKQSAASTAARADSRYRIWRRR
jgi:hypothetical protein